MAISIVQTSSHYHGQNVGSKAGALASAPAAGNAIIVMIGGYRSSGFDVGSVTDDRGNTYTLAKKSNLQTEIRSAIYYALNVAALTPTITVNAAAGTDNFIEFGALEVSGLAASGVVDQTASANGATTTTPPSGTTAATTVADELLIAVMTADNGNTLNIQPAGGWTQSHVENDGANFLNWSAVRKTVAATGTQSHTWSGSNGEYSACIATFKADQGLAAAALGQASASASLTTAIRLAATPVAVATATAALTTAIRMLATAQAVASFAANFSFFNAQAQALATATANLTTAIQLRADPVAIATATAALTTQIRLAAAAIAQAGASAAFPFEIGRIKAELAFDSIIAAASVQIVRATAAPERSIQAKAA